MSGIFRHISRQNIVTMVALLLLFSAQIALVMHAPAHLMETAGIGHSAHVSHDDGDHHHDDTSPCGVCFVGKGLSFAWLFLPVLVFGIAAHRFMAEAAVISRYLKSLLPFHSRAPPVCF